MLQEQILHLGRQQISLMVQCSQQTWLFKTASEMVLEVQHGLAHNGGGVGWGSHQWRIWLLIDGSQDSERKLLSMLDWDVNNGILGGLGLVMMEQFSQSREHGRKSKIKGNTTFDWMTH